MGVMPYGSMPILKARKQGKRPADLIIASMLGALLNELNPVVVVDKANSYEWSWIRGLPLCFFATKTTYLAKHVFDAAKAQPSKIYLWFCDSEQGFDLWVLPTVESIGRNKTQWVMKIDSLRWKPFQEQQFALGELKWN